MIDNYPWLTPVWRKLSECWQQQKFPHALLLCGSQGVGKQVLVENFLAYIFCMQPSKQGACGQCRACQLWLAGTYPDWQFLAPEKIGKAIKVDDIRAMNEWIQLSPLLGKYKALLIKPVEAMNVAASNALLKTLEEPPANTFIILLSEQPHRLLATIRSRCQKWAVPMPSEAEAKAWLAKQSPAAASLWRAGLGPLAVLANSQEGGKDEWLLWQEALTQFLKQQQNFLELSQKFAKTDPIICVDVLIDFIYRRQLAKNISASVEAVLFYEELLQLKKQMLKGANFNWQLQLDYLLPKFQHLMR